MTPHPDCDVCRLGGTGLHKMQKLDLSRLVADFPFEYVGGGYWRRRGVPRGERSETLHGAEVLSALAASL